ncbi:hypothetical protein K503DRAFT_778068 [Rhizopogon vinicolor AM-OR11-026]|uniref:DUF6534 domain-containing protein n=1 Tax=Rhizopogon vinicolor AM-OR11-026 TaxID=1314800 RepID=A0A1B7MDM7_9AGAM|nr:hypothetical protein K503DRAFT_778068 [Rhizopogon vinicolor AM-OR11-026]
MLLVIANFSFGLQTAVFMFSKTFGALQQIILYPVVPLAVASLLSDLCIAIALCVLLHGNRSPIIETNTLINTLIVYAVNRCLLSLVVIVAEVTAFAISTNSLWFIAIDFIIGKLYINSFLASLNSRNSLRGRNNESASLHLNTINISGLGSSREGDNSATTKNKKSSVSGDAHIKQILDDDLGLLEVSNFGGGKV